MDHLSPLTITSFLWLICHQPTNVQSPGATITLENARGQGIGAADLSYLSGIDASQLEAKELFNGDLELKLAALGEGAP